MTVTPARYVLIPLASLVTGYTVKAIYKKIESGVWREHHEWRKAPDGHIFVDLEGIRKWVESPQQAA